jgi:hypothetical protein
MDIDPRKPIIYSMNPSTPEREMTAPPDLFNPPFPQPGRVNPFDSLFLQQQPPPVFSHQPPPGRANPYDSFFLRPDQRPSFNPAFPSVPNPAPTRPNQKF